MTIAFQSATQDGGNASPQTCPYPASIAAGDLLVLIYMQSTDDFKLSELNSAGFTEYDTAVTGPSSYVERRYFKIATGSESGTLSVNTGTGSGHPFLTAMLRFTGNFGPSPLSGMQSNSNAASSTTIASPDPGPTNSGSQVVIATAGANGSASATTTESAGYSEAVDHQRGAGGLHTQVVAYATGASPGACTFTFTAAQVNRLSTSFIISEPRSSMMFRYAS